MRFFQILGVVILSVILGLFALYLFVDKRAPHYITSALKNSGFENAKIGSFDYGFSGFSLKNIQLDNVGLSKIDEITGQYSLMSILRGSREVENITMAGVHLQGTYTKDKILSINGYGKIFEWKNQPQDQSLKISLPVLPFATLKIRDAIIDLTTPYGNLTFQAEGNLERKQNDIYFGNVKLASDSPQLNFTTSTDITLNPVKNDLKFLSNIMDMNVSISDIELLNSSGNFEFDITDDDLTFKGNILSEKAQYKAYKAQDVELYFDSNDVENLLKGELSPPNSPDIKISISGNSRGFIVQSNQISFSQLSNIIEGANIPDWLQTCKPVNLKVTMPLNSETPNFSYEIKNSNLNLPFSGYGEIGEGKINVTTDKNTYAINSLKNFCNIPALSNITAGTITPNGSVIFIPSDENLSITSNLKTNLSKLSGKLGSYDFSDLNGDVSLKKLFPSLEGYSSNMRIKSIEKDETKLTDTDFKIALTGKSSAPQITLSDVSTHMWEGNLNAKKISLSPKGQINSPVKLQFNNFELGKLLDLLKVSGLNAKGILSGYVTLAQSEKGLMISEGQLNNEEKGYIRYSPESYPRALQGDDTRMQTVRNALTNFTFDELNTQISGPLDGDLTVVLSAKGKNKALSEERPIHLNLTIEGALSPLLKSFLKPLSVKPTLNDNEKSQ